MQVVAILLTLFLKISQSDLSPINWLPGRWVSEASASGAQSYEIWQKISDQQFTGVGYTVNGADTSFSETLQITRQGDDFFYMADVPHNPAPVAFKIIEMSEDALVCENLAHDFPQRIEYKRSGPSLEVIISAGEKARTFHFKKSED